MRIARLLAAALAATLLVVLPSGPARAHNSLVKAVPAKNATLDRAPTGVELAFLQKVDPASLTITVTRAGQGRVASGPPKADGRTGAIVFSAPLPDGVYSVAYRVASLDGHPVQGSYRFTVGDPSAAPGLSATPARSATPPRSAAPVASAPTAVSSASVGPPPGAVAGEVEDSRGWPVIAGMVAVVALLVGVAVWLARRRRAT